ncbi:hypothetical protein [Sediminicola luteus]|uniref:Uncharacterized protein n=1 Tax=Sediminicola luteus TaxID=319238 RepID=A0A2A4GDP7_9FLAO|nr:hypothetical protein [Sediminicola luteus]PCE66541.1 hypothetical protein B7P33_04390 [Sediminicola luteus]
MKTTEFARSIENLPKKEKTAILEIIDLKISNEMREVISEIRGLKETMNAKYNVLLGMISFLVVIVTVVSLFLGLKG